MTIDKTDLGVAADFLEEHGFAPEVVMAIRDFEQAHRALKAMRAHDDGAPGSLIRTLTNAYNSEHDWQNDDDQEATRGVVEACIALADAVEATFPVPEPPTLADVDEPYVDM
jgi:hypothetical protein